MAGYHRAVDSSQVAGQDSASGAGRCRVSELFWVKSCWKKVCRPVFTGVTGRTRWFSGLPSISPRDISIVSLKRERKRQKSTHNCPALLGLQSWCCLVWLRGCSTKPSVTNPTPRIPRQLVLCKRRDPLSGLSLSSGPTGVSIISRFYDCQPGLLEQPILIAACHRSRIESGVTRDHCRVLSQARPPKLSPPPEPAQ